MIPLNTFGAYLIRFKTPEAMHRYLNNVKETKKSLHSSYISSVVCIDANLRTKDISSYIKVYIDMFKHTTEMHGLTLYNLYDTYNPKSPSMYSFTTDLSECMESLEFLLDGYSHCTIIKIYKDLNDSLPKTRNISTPF